MTKVYITTIVILAFALFSDVFVRYELTSEDATLAAGVKTVQYNPLLWGVLPDRQVADCASGVGTLYLQRNILDRLIATLTLGIWSPASISYQCAKETPIPGALE